MNDTTKTTAHANCDHEATKAARAKCRRDAKIALIAGDQLEAAAKAPEVKRTTKTIKRHSFSDDTVTLEIEKGTMPHTGTPIIKVWHEGSYLGHIQQYKGSRDRLAGMIRIPGKVRNYWVPTAKGHPTSYWNLCDSQAEAMRALLPLDR